jgi:hypothetical protein
MRTSLNVVIIYFISAIGCGAIFASQEIASAHDALLPSATETLAAGQTKVCHCSVSDTQGCDVETPYGEGDRCDCGRTDANNTCTQRPCIGVYEACH